MKWPWVSRATHDAAVAHHVALARIIGTIQSQLLDERQRYDALLEKFTALRVQGAVAEAPKEAIANLPGAIATPPDEMLALIDQRAGNNTRVRGMMLRQLAADRAANVSDEDIRNGILNGYTPSGVPA